MFEGITPAASEFLFALALHNEREWFMPRKEEFKALVDTPLRSLAAETLDLMRGQFPEADFQPHVSRIYRDARRLHGGGPYRDHLWFSLQSGDTRANGPMFWFELTAVSYAYGMGFWAADSAWGQAFRAAIDADPNGFAGRLEPLENTGYRLWGQTYKRLKADRGPLLNPWYNSRSVSVGWEFPFGEELADPALPHRLLAAYAPLMPLFRFYQTVWHSLTPPAQT